MHTYYLETNSTGSICCRFVTRGTTNWTSGVRALAYIRRQRYVPCGWVSTWRRLRLWRHQSDNDVTLLTSYDDVMTHHHRHVTSSCHSNQVNNNHYQYQQPQLDHNAGNSHVATDGQSQDVPKHDLGHFKPASQWFQLTRKIWLPIIVLL